MNVMSIDTGDSETRLQADFFRRLTHSQLASAFSLCTGNQLTAESGASRAAIIKKIGGHFPISDTELLQSPESCVYPKRWDTPAEALDTANRSFILPTANSRTSGSSSGSSSSSSSNSLKEFCL